MKFNDLFKNKSVTSQLFYKLLGFKLNYLLWNNGLGQV